MPITLTMQRPSITNNGSTISVDFDLNRTLVRRNGDLRCVITVNRHPVSKPATEDTVTLQFWVSSDNEVASSTYNYTGTLNPTTTSVTATVNVVIMNVDEDPSGDPIDQDSMETGIITP